MDLHTSLLAALVSPRGAGVDYVGGMAVVLLLSGHDENKLKSSEDHAVQVAAAMRWGNRGPTGRVIGECRQQWRWQQLINIHERIIDVDAGCLMVLLLFYVVGE